MSTDIIGTLGRDPELRFTPAGQAICSFSVAVNRKWTNRSTNQEQEETSWFDVVAWGSLGENVSESLSKGDRVIVVGRLQQRSWETQTGEKKAKVEIVADAIGPDLRFATCTVLKAGRDKPATAAAQPVYAYDEEPF